MRFLVRLVPLEPDRAASLATFRSIAANLGERAANPKWTSRGTLEVDVFAPSRQDFQLFLAAVAPLANIEFAKDLQEAPPFLTKEGAVKEAAALFNQERFWEAHEVLESKWRVAGGEEKRLLQGLILVCAAFVHHQKDEDGVALGIAKRSLPLLAWPERVYLGVDVERVRDRISTMVEAGRLSVFEL